MDNLITSFKQIVKLKFLFHSHSKKDKNLLTLSKI